MDIYTRKSQWKWYLAAAGIAIVIISLLYTRYLAQQLVNRENHQALQFAEALRSLGKANRDSTQYNCDVSLHSLVITQNANIPVILLDERWRIIEYQNIGDNNIKQMDTADVRRALNRMVADWTDTIEISAPPYFRNYLIYSHSRLLPMLNFYPLVQFILIAAFILLGYMGFSASRRAEENQVWLGMAKETAHQLGTPITAILGWLEALKATNEGHEQNLEMLHELGNDITRLELVADRFSKIGSKPELYPTNLYEQLELCREYMQRRSPRRITFDFPVPGENPPMMVNINPHLFDWVVENLLRNAIDSMEDGRGDIHCVVYPEGNHICFDISDTGKGIATGKFQTVFKPGYSTKKRGWGLGLSLSKRIIDQYHGGKIMVKRSEVGKGTTFTVKLPKIV
ncbi:MAG: HAMP domain-containing histidine kinase [Saprospiraceae bacterium]|nr:HAMP domain-containing histidine kinase [Saprospiraceae bacterium]